GAGRNPAQTGPEAAGARCARVDRRRRRAQLPRIPEQPGNHQMRREVLASAGGIAPSLSIGACGSPRRQDTSMPAASALTLRDATDADGDAIWDIFRVVVA